MKREKNASQPAVKRLRRYRDLHRKIAIVLFGFFLLIALTGLLLGWKKHSGGIILPESTKGVSPQLKTWLSLDSLHRIAVRTLHDSVSAEVSAELERIDARPQKGMIKFVFVEGYWEIQLDGTTGRVLLLAHRRSDFIENIHDGSILDRIFGTDGELKLAYTSVMGGALVLLTLTGFWLWYGPQRLRNQKNSA